MTISQVDGSPHSVLTMAVGVARGAALRWLGGLARLICQSLAVVVSVAVLGSAAHLCLLSGAPAWLGLPDAGTLALILRRPIVTIDRAADGSVHATCQCFLPVSGQDVSAYARSAIIAIEDRKFLTHSGVDWIRTALAIGLDAWNLRVVAGGSTITQQLAKTIVGAERTGDRKLRDMVMAKEIETVFSKEEIADLYLNRVYYGHGATGIENAARIYFGLHAKDVSIYDAAMLAGMVRAPSNLNPIDAPVAAADRTRVVLDSMVETGYLTRAQEAQGSRKRDLPRFSRARGSRRRLLPAMDL